MTTGSNDPWTVFWDDINRPGPHSQLAASVVALFSGGEGGGAAFWVRQLDRLIYIPKDETTVMRPLNDFVNLCVHSVTPDTIGFQLESFSYFAPRIWEMLGREMSERASFNEILLYYEGLTLGASAKDRKVDINFQLDKMRELRELLGHVTILRPEHARTIAL